ncbi:hypothetical protein HYU16_01435 [Candidatus Woesearchaeota archaeon]|nr:hypothetical protein [Candidatus Woesearchaeota archaeon]
MLVGSINLLLTDFPGFVGGEARELMEKINAQYLMWLSKKARRVRMRKRQEGSATNVVANALAKEVMLDERRGRWLRHRQTMEA